MEVPKELKFLEQQGYEGNSEPMARRFMQGMAASLMLIAGWALFAQQFLLSYIAQGFIAVAFSALLFGKFCMGAYLYHMLNGNLSFANRTI